MTDDKLLSLLLPGDVILTSHLGFNVIKIGNFCKNGFDRRMWTHAALYIGDGNIVEAFPKGITRRKLQDAYLTDRRVGLKVLRRQRLTPDVAQRVVDICAKAKGSPYDFRALIYFPLANLLPPSLGFILSPGYLGHWFNQEHSYFCSELISRGFKEADAYCFEREPFQVMPVDFDNGLLFDEVAVRPLPGKEEQGRVRAFLLEGCYVVAAVFLFVLFLLILSLSIAFAVLMFRRFLRGVERKGESAANQGNPGDRIRQ